MGGACRTYREGLDAVVKQQGILGREEDTPNQQNSRETPRRVRHEGGMSGFWEGSWKEGRHGWLEGLEAGWSSRQRGYLTGHHVGPYRLPGHRSSSDRMLPHPGLKSGLLLLLPSSLRLVTDCVSADSSSTTLA